MISLPKKSRTVILHLVHYIPAVSYRLAPEEIDVVFLEVEMTVEYPSHRRRRRRHQHHRRQ